MHPIFQEHITGCMEWYNNFYERYCDEKIYSSQKDLSRRNELRILEYSIEAEEPSIEWEFSIPNWLDKIAQEHQLLTSTMFSNNDTKIRYELSLNPKLIRLLDSTIFSERNYSEFLRATRQKRIGVEVSSSAEKRIRREEPELLDGNQFRIIGEIIYMRNDLPQQQNSERDIDMFIKRHIFSCFDTILDSHFGEVVSRLQGIVEQKL
ncbi:unnamed protein product [Rhizophagus irregularis]|nr:unnamed protein product [Rhizophagus irregularis]